MPEFASARLIRRNNLLDAARRGREKRNRASENEFPHMEQPATAEPAHSIQEDIHRYYADGEEYVRQNPAKSALVGMGIGFLLAQLPLRWMFIAIIKLLFLVVKPVTFIYAISKLIDDVRTARAD
jgi:ElaB/YqjD/DUF883 family membrane-anchored ribosome-binding protein